ncbi:MAG: hypothetical protein NVS9B4_12750 [Candidatus Acidiferrum sp.]
MRQQATTADLTKKSIAMVLLLCLLSPTSPAMPAATYVGGSRAVTFTPILLKTFLPLPQESTPAAPANSSQQITLAEDGKPIAAANVALVLANMNKISLGKTDEQGKTDPALDLANGVIGGGKPDPALASALKTANLGKVELHAEVDECANGNKQVYLVGPDGKLPAPGKDCKRRRLAGTFKWGQSSEVVLDILRGTLEARGNAANGGGNVVGKPADVKAGAAQNAAGQTPATNNTVGQTPTEQNPSNNVVGQTATGQNPTNNAVGQTPTGKTPTNTTVGQSPTGQDPNNNAIGQRATGQNPTNNAVGQTPTGQPSYTTNPRMATVTPQIKDLATHQMLEQYFSNLASNISKTQLIGPDGPIGKPDWYETNGQPVGLATREGLVLTQYITLQQLQIARADAAPLLTLTDEQKTAMLTKLREQSVNVKEKYAVYQNLQNQVGEVHGTVGGVRDQYNKFMGQVAKLESEGRHAEAEDLLNNIRGSLYGRFVSSRNAFYRALGVNPLLGVRLTDGGPHFFEVVSKNTSVEELKKAFDDYTAHYSSGLTEQIDRISKFHTVQELWELGGPQFAQTRAVAAAYGGDFTKGLIDALEGAYGGTKAVADYDKALTDTLLAVGQAIPVAGLGFTAIQIYREGADYVVALSDEKNAQATASVTGYQGLIEANERRDSAGNKLAFSVALLPAQIPGLIQALKTGKNLKIVKAGAKGSSAVAADAKAAGTTLTKIGSEGSNAVASDAKAAANKVGSEVPKGAVETPGFAPGRTPPISEKEAEIMLRDFIVRQDKIGGVQEVEAEIALARKAGVPEETIKELTQDFNPKGLPSQNKLIATDLMEARLRALGYDLNMTGEEFNTLQGISVRSSAKGAGLSQKDIDFLRTKVAADPNYFKKLPQRGYSTKFGKDVFHGRSQPKEGFIAGLDAESALEIEKAFQKWNGATEASGMLKGFEDAVRSKVPAADLKDAAMALKTDPQAMRSLKSAPNEVKDAFNTAEGLVYAEHDKAVLDHVRGIKLDKQGKPAPWSQPGVELEVHDFRTPGTKGTGVNTDRDFRVIYKDPQNGWLEVPKEYWQEHSTLEFAKASGYTPRKLEAIAAAEDVQAWKNWDPAKHNGQTVEQAMQDKWKELHQQLGTDKYHPEASVEFSDQGIRNGEHAEVAKNIESVKKGDAMLKDPEGFGMMYHEKADAYVRLKSQLHPQGDRLEAMAQLNKGIEMMTDVRGGYAKFFGKNGAQSPLGALPKNFEEAAAEIQKLAPFDKTITAEQVAAVEQKLRDLGFAGPLKTGDPLKGFINALDGQFEALKTVAAPGSVSAAKGATGAAQSAANTATEASVGAKAGSGLAPAVNSAVNGAGNKGGTGGKGGSGGTGGDAGGNAGSGGKGGNAGGNTGGTSTPGGTSGQTGGTPGTSGGTTVVQAECEEVDCSAQEQRVRETIAAFEEARGALDQASRNAAASAAAMNAAATAVDQAKAATPPNPAGIASAEANLAAAKQRDAGAAEAQQKASAALDAAKESALKAQADLEKCQEAGKKKCDEKTAAMQPKENSVVGGNGQGGKVAGNGAGGTTVAGGGAVTGGTGAGGTSVTGGGAGTGGTGAGGTTVAGGTGTGGSTTVGGGGTPGVKACKKSNEDCAELGRDAAAKQLDATRAKDDLRQVPMWMSEAEAAQRDAFRLHDEATNSFTRAGQYEGLKDKANAESQRVQGRDYQARGDAAQAKADALKAKAEGAQGRADAAEKAAADAWAQYYACLHLPPCPEHAETTPTGGNTIGGGPAGGAVNVGGGAQGGFANCPAAKAQMDEAAYWHQQAAIDAAKMSQALSTGDMRAAEYLRNSMVQDERNAQNHERQAAYELERCNQKTLTAGGGSNAMIPGPGATQPTNPTGSTGAASAPGSASSAGGNAGTTPAGNAAKTSAEIGAPPAEGTSTSCMPGSSGCATPNQCVSDARCFNVKDVCKTSPNACAGGSGESPYQVMMTASAIKSAKSSRRAENVRFIPASYHRGRLRTGIPSEALLAAMPGPEDRSKMDVALVATGNSSGEAFQLQVRDPSGRTERAALPEGVVLEPVKPGGAKPPAAQGMSNLLTQQIGGFCVQFLKLPPEIGMVYKIAGPMMQEKYQPARLVLQAGRALAEKGKLHPDSDPDSYADSVRQYAVWAKQEGWDEKKFGDNFVERTKKNAEVRKVKWSQQIETALRGAVPGRWRDITQVLELAGAWQKSTGSSPTRATN